MLKLDFMNKEYSVAEIIDVYTDGSIENFKGDEDFLTFLISYAIGNYIVGPDAEDFKEYAEYDGILNMMLLDEYGYFGTKLYKLYEICGKSKIKFMQLCGLIGKYGVFTILDKAIIDRNLQLTEPVPFMDDDMVLSSGIKPILDPKDHFMQFSMRYEDREEFEYEVNRSLKQGINESIKRNHDGLELFPEMTSYVEKREQEEKARLAKMVPDDYILNINNLFYGTEIYDASGGIINLGMKIVSWFENMNMSLVDFHIFRSIPAGDYCLLDDNANIHIPEAVLCGDGVEVGPNTPIRSVNIANISTILRTAIEILEEDQVTNEASILDLKGLLEILETKQFISVQEAKGFEHVIRVAYEIAYGEIFKPRGENLEGFGLN